MNLLKTNMAKGLVLGALVCFGAPSIPWIDQIVSMVPGGKNACQIITSTTYDPSSLNTDDNPYYVNCNITQQARARILETLPVREEGRGWGCGEEAELD